MIPLSFRIALVVVPNLAAIPIIVSPAFTLYVRVPVVDGRGEAGVAEALGAALEVAGAVATTVAVGRSVDADDALAWDVS